jgi:cell division transport system ATP-binding protein
VIECLQLSKSYGKECDLFQGATLCVRKGEWLVVSGGSGSGKTTFLRILLAVECPDAGQVLFQRQNVHEIPAPLRSALRRKMGVVAQNGPVAMEWTVFENVALPLVLAGKDRWLIKKRVLHALESLGLHRKAHARCGALNASERRRVEIARAAIHNPLIFLADEPFQGLESEDRALVTALFSELSVGGSTFVILSRETPEMLGMAGARCVRIAHRRFVEGLSASVIPPVGAASV